MEVPTKSPNYIYLHCEVWHISLSFLTLQFHSIYLYCLFNMVSNKKKNDRPITLLQLVNTCQNVIGMC
jgi:hypothetical protein